MNKTQKEYVVEDFLSAANKLLEGLDDVGSLVSDLPSLSTEAAGTAHTSER